MKTPQSLLPDLSTLTERLNAALRDEAINGGEIKILRRNLPPFMSTFPNEIVTCQWPGGRKRRLFVKYQSGQSHDSFGHRGDVPYEAEVYRQVIRPLQNLGPKYLGAHLDPNTGHASLFLEFIHGCVRVSDISWKRSVRQPRAMTRTSRLIAMLHKSGENRIEEQALAFLKRYDAEYFRGWARRTFEFAAPLRKVFPWLGDLRRAGEAWFAPLLKTRQTLIHGEFYAKTVLLRRESLFAVDWESAAISAGEIDLAALTEGTRWPAAIVRRCENEYARTRWPNGIPPDFQKTLDAAKIYLHFRWLGERSDWTIREKTMWRYDHLHASAQRLGLID